MALTTACPKPSYVLQRHAKRVTAKQRLADAYAKVDARDGGYSVVSGVYTQSGSPDQRVRREHDHFRGRNVAPEWKYDEHRIATVTAFEHQLLHAGILKQEGDDMRKRVVYHWNYELMERGKEPFRLKSKRWSQNKDRDVA